MEIEVLEQSKTKLKFNIKGEDYTILNLLKEELWQDKNTKIAAYRVAHPLVGTPEMNVEVNPSSDVKKVIKNTKRHLEK